MKTKNIVRPLMVTLGILFIPLFGTLLIDGWAWDDAYFFAVGYFEFLPFAGN